MTTERDIRNQIAYARREGKEEAKLEMAKALKDNGVSAELIEKCSGLSIETIADL